jgi:X-X-X-Leu-X-X-Gly heptad repeat protein
MVQPESAGDVPFGPVSWYGVARPRALSGLAGTMMSQLVLSAAACAAGADAEALPDGQGAGAAEAAAAGALAPAAGALAAGAAALAAGAAALAAGAGALALAAGAGALALAAGAAWLPLAAGAAPLAAAAAEAHEPRADCSMVVALPPPETARTIPRVRPSAIGMASGTAIRAARLLRRRDADPCPLSIQSTSIWEVPCDAPGASP